MKPKIIWNNVVRFALRLSVVAGLAVAPAAWSADTDTGESAEIQFSSPAATDLRNKAAALGSLVDVYEYVRNHYDFALYHGVRSGSINTFLGGRGNDVDLAATLIAMLRSLPTPTPARYVVGTVRLPAAQAMNWLGVKNIDLAYGILRNQGIQGAVLAADKSTIDFEHVWVEALVPYDRYRGAGANVNCATTPAVCHWVPLDPSFKQHEVQNAGLDPYANLTFDYTAYYNAMRNNDATRLGKNPFDIYQEQVLAWLQTTAPGKTLEDIPDFGGIVAEHNGLLPASLPYATLGNLRRYNSMADHDAAVPATEPKKWGKRLSISFYMVAPLDGGGTFTVNLGAGNVSLAQISTQRLTVTTEFPPPGNVPNVVTRLGGTEIARPLSGNGTIVGYTPAIGDPFTLTVSMDGAPAPDANGTDQVISASYNGIIGGYYLVATGGETSNWSQVHRAAQQLLAANVQYPIVFRPGEPGCQPGGIDCTPYVDTNANGWDAADPKLIDHKPALDALTGGLLYVASTQYYAKMRDDMEQADALNKIRTPISGFLGVVSSTHEVEYIDGTAFSVLPGGLLIDMKGISISGSWRIDQPAEASNKQFELIGHIVSSLEHEVWQELTGYDAISTVRGIQMALASGANLANPKKNPTTDTIPAAYTSFGFSTGAAPAGFNYVPFSLFGTQPATWTHATNGAAFDLMQSVVTTGTSSLRRSRANYIYSTGSGLYAWVSCVDGQRAQLQTYINNGQGTASASMTFCDGSARSGTINDLMSQLQTFYLSTVIPTYIGTTYFNYFDRAQGFVPTDHVYRATPLANTAQFTSLVQRIRDDLSLRDIGQAWIEYLLPSTQTVSPLYKFSVDIRKGHETVNGKLVSASFEILNNTGVAAGGGYVPAGGNVLTPARAILGTSNVTPTYNNATLTDQNTIAETNNDPLKTPSTADPVSTVTGNNYHDETDFTLKGRGINYVFTRTYNSTPSSTKLNGPLGFGWTHSYAMRLKSNDYGNCPNCTPGTGAGQRPENGNNLTSSITYTDERGGEHNYLVNEATLAATSPQGEFDALAFDTPAAGQHTLTFRNGTKYIFEGASNIKTAPNVTARLMQIADPWGNQLNFGYDGSGRLSTVTDNLGIGGRTGLAFAYDGAGKLTGISDWGGRQWNYSVNGGGDLVSYTNPLNQQVRYTYAPGTHNLFEIIKPLARGGQDVKTAFTYYQNGRAFNYANSLGHTETLDYDLYRNSTRVTDPRGGIRTYEYDSAGRMTKLTEPDGAVLLFANQADGVRFSKTDGLGYKTQYSYRGDKSLNTASDTFGNVTREQDALNQTVDMTYGPYDQLASVKDKRGIVKTTTFHATTDGTCAAAGKPDTVTVSLLAGVANVPLQSFCWFSDGTLRTVTDYILPGNTSRYRRRTYIYDAAHLNVLSITDTGSDSTTVTKSFGYDSLGRKISETLQRRTSPTNAAPIGLTTNYTYDNLDRVTRVEDAAGHRLDTVFDANGQVSQLLGHYRQSDGSYVSRTLSTRTYDAADRLISDADVYNVTTQYRYDPAGNLIARIDPYGHTTRYEYDAMNRKTATIDANGHRTTTVYDLAGRVKSVTNANNETVTHTYDAIGRLTQTQDPLGFLTQFSYDANGNLTCTVDANASAGLQPRNSDNCSESRVYDELNRVIQIKDALNGITATAYDLLGNITAITDAANKTTAFAFDDLGRHIGTTDPLNKATLISRDEANNAYQVTNRLNQITQVSFDALNRPTNYAYLTDGTSETITYDPFGNKATANNATVNYIFTYDAKNRLLSKTDSRNNKQLSFAYDAVGNLITKTDYQNHTTDFQYDSSNRLVSLQNPAYVKALYQYDPAGRLLTRVLSDNVSSTFAYDANGRLTTLMMLSANGAPITNLSYTHDRVGQITQATGLFGANLSDTRNYTYNARYQLTQVDATGTANDETFTYDNVGNRTTHTQGGQLKTYRYYLNSNRLLAVRVGTASGPIEKSFTYNDEGRLTGQSGQGAKTLTWDQKGRATQITAGANTNLFNYDPMDYRIQRSGGTLGNRHYYLEGEHLEAEYNNNNQLQTKYFRGITTDELIAGFSLINGKLTPSLYHHDQLTSVTGHTAHDGTSQQGLVYRAFGDTQTLTGSDSNRLRYTGRELDIDTGLYYYRARYYDPAIGRFISEDPLGFEAGINFYAYVNNNPINGNDPSGLDTNCLGESCTFRTGGISTTPFPRPAGFPNAINADSSFYHLLNAQVPVANSALTAGQINTGLVVQPTPGPANNPATSQGTLNNANPGGLLSLGAQSWPVMSYVVSDVATKAPVVLNVTQPGHPLFPGVVARYTSGTPGNYTVNNVGEGTAAIESGLNPFAAPIYMNTWTEQTNSILNGLGNQSSGAAGGFLLYPNKTNTNQMQSVYAK